MAQNEPRGIVALTAQTQQILVQAQRQIELAESAFTAAPVCARQRAPRQMLAGGHNGRTP